jgi:hypothetical protein
MTPRPAYPTRRLIVRSIIAALLATAGSQALARAAAGAGPVISPWPRCAPLCAHAPARRPRITAIYLSTHKTRGRVTVTIDAFAAGIPSRSVTGRLCYEAHHARNEPGCIVTATAHGRRVGAGVWWLRFRTPVYERYQIANTDSHALVRSYWFGVSVPVGDTSAEGSRHGFFHFGRPSTRSRAPRR